MKIVILTRSLEVGGAQRQVVTLAGGLRERGHNVVVAVFYGGHVLERGLEEAGIPLCYLGKTGRWDVPGFLSRLIRFLRRERPDVLYAFQSGASIFGTLARPLMSAKLVWGVRHSNMDFSRYGRVPCLAYRLQCAMSHIPDLIIANSRAGLDHARSNGFPDDRSIVIPNGIDTELFRPDPESRQRVRAELGVSGSEMLIGLVGRLDVMKDHPTFLRAAARLARVRADVRFVCVGPGKDQYACEIRALADSLGLASRIIWAGARGDMPAVYNALDMLVSSSSFGEGFPNVLGEAMACGTPCVVTHVGDSPWVVGDCGEIVMPRDPVALDAAITRMLDRIAAGDIHPDRVRDRILTHFALSRAVDSTEAALLKLCGCPTR